jgi:hypothetical protein
MGTDVHARHIRRRPPCRFVKSAAPDAGEEMDAGCDSILGSAMSDRLEIQNTATRFYRPVPGASGSADSKRPKASSFREKTTTAGLFNPSMMRQGICHAEKEPAGSGRTASGLRDATVRRRCGIRYDLLACDAIVDSRSGDGDAPAKRRNHHTTGAG